MKIYTKTGDDGTTLLYGGKRVSKADIQIEAYGTIDELNAYIGLLGDFEANAWRKQTLKTIQDRLFTIGAALAADAEKSQLKKPDLLLADVELLEKEIDQMQEQLPALKHFILPGGHMHVSFCHLARTVCRRAERLVIHFVLNTPVEPLVLMYLNRLSDYLFVLARIMTKDLGVEEINWKPRY